MKRIIGLTGLSGAGKSTVAEVFASLGATVIDCDKIAHEALAEPSVKNALVSSFGSGILAPNGSIDRKALASLAFSEEQATKRLNAATHPFILAETRRRAAAAAGVAVIDAPLLFSSGLDALCDVTVAVTANRSVRIKRIRLRDNITVRAAEKRLAAQKGLKKKLSQADYLLHNNLTENDLKTEAKRLYRIITE